VCSWIDTATVHGAFTKEAFSQKQNQTMHRSVSFLIAFLAFITPLYAQKKGWEMFDSSKPGQTPQESNAHVIYKRLLKLIDDWNSHDIDGYLEFYWNSPELLVVDDWEQLDGWQKFHDSLAQTFRDPRSMGSVEPARIQIRLLTPNVAYGLVWLKFYFPDSKKLGQVRTIVLQKFDEAWKIVVSQACSGELQ
jgi:hypothetical protein